MAATVASIFILAGCDSRQKEDFSGTLVSEELPEQVTPREASISLSSVGLEDSPEENAWPTEIFNEEAGDQFARLKTALEKSLPPPNDIFSENSRIPRLRPAALNIAYEDERFLIQRHQPASMTGATTSDDISNFALWVAPYESGSIKAEFKIFEVQAEPATVTTKVAAKLWGDTDAGRLQETATWTCVWTNTSPPRLRAIHVSEYESSLLKRAGDEPAFNDCTEAIFDGVTSYDNQLTHGVDHWVDRIEAAFGINVSGWEGLAIGDANGDGLDDVYLCQPGGLPNRLFIQKAGGTVFDASSFAGVDWRIQTQSALFVDLDNDGDQDLVIATALGVIFMANDGRGTFSVKASELIPEAAPLGLSSADYDLDGDLDLYAACYSRRRSHTNATILGRPIPYHDANNGGRNVLFRNDGNWKFTNATLETGLDANNRRFSFAAAWEDYDNDGDLDLYVANDYGRNNLYRNDQSGDGTHTFTDVAKEAGVEDISAGMSVSWGDYNLDGHMDLYVSNMWSSAGNRVTYQRQFQADAGETALAEMQRHARGNSLFMNAGDGSFHDVSVKQGVTMGRWAWGSRFIDLNTDGWDDILVANGFITQPADTGDL